MAKRVCPVWVGYLLASPIRKLFQNPQRILSPYVENGMKVLDVGCAMGFFKIIVSAAEQKGFKIIERPQIGRSRAVLLEKENVPEFLRTLELFEKCVLVTSFL